MSRHTTWKTGGLADYYYSPADIEDLATFISILPETLPIIWVGNGSNLLVHDDGIRGVIISVTGVLDTIEQLEKNTLKLGGGLACVKAARTAAKYGLSGIEFLAGIPGTIGGALVMNAGAYGGEIWNRVQQVEMINRSGEINSPERGAFDIAYRSVNKRNNEWFLSATILLEQKDSASINQTIRSMLAERAEAQPLGQLSCGSVFRNPDGDYAARLIEVSGLKGFHIGDAYVSEKHANFIINAGNASSNDIASLIEHIRQTVFNQHGVSLKPEVKLIGGPYSGAEQ